ncbi:MAG: protein kinase [Planctomycetota bacterium]
MVTNLALDCFEKMDESTFPPTRTVDASDLRPVDFSNSEFGEAYQVLRLIAEHGQGQVYLAYDKHLSRQVVIKRCKESVDQWSRQTLIEEGRILASLDHSNLARVFHLGFDSTDCPFLVMEFIEGRNLAEVMRDGSWTAGEATEMILKVAEALAHANEAGVIHCDIKPANIVIGKDGTVKLIDFGLAQTRSPLIAEECTSSGGTVAYMPPEQARSMLENDKFTANEQIDVFGLGAIYFELLAGERLYDGPNLQSVLEKAADCNINFDSLTQKGLPDSCLTVCQKALAADTQNRFRNAREFADNLDGAPDSRQSISPLQIAKHPFVIPICTVAIILSVGGYWIFGSPRNRDNGADEDLAKANQQQLSSHSNSEGHESPPESQTHDRDNPSNEEPDLSKSGIAKPKQPLDEETDASSNNAVLSEPNQEEPSESSNDSGFSQSIVGAENLPASSKTDGGKQEPDVKTPVEQGRKTTPTSNGPSNASERYNARIALVNELKKQNSTYCFFQLDGIEAILGFGEDSDSNANGNVGRSRVFNRGKPLLGRKQHIADRGLEIFILPDLKKSWSVFVISPDGSIEPLLSSLEQSSGPSIRYPNKEEQLWFGSQSGQYTFLFASSEDDLTPIRERVANTANSYDLSRVTGSWKWSEGKSEKLQSSKSILGGIAKPGFANFPLKSNEPLGQLCTQLELQELDVAAVSFPITLP